MCVVRRTQKQVDGEARILLVCWCASERTGLGEQGVDGWLAHDMTAMDPLLPLTAGCALSKQASWPGSWPKLPSVKDPSAESFNDRGSCRSSYRELGFKLTSPSLQARS